MLSASVASVLYILCNFHQCSKPKFPSFCIFFATIPMLFSVIWTMIIFLYPSTDNHPLYEA